MSLGLRGVQETEHDLSEGSEQLEWLEEQLAVAEADPDYRFTILYLHRPLYTLGDYRPREDQRDVLFPVLAAHRIPLVLAGHVHGYERFEYPDTTHVVTGADRTGGVPSDKGAAGVVMGDSIGTIVCRRRKIRYPSPTYTAKFHTAQRIRGILCFPDLILEIMFHY